MGARYDVIVIGGGHNSLVAAAYLARAGRRVLLLERRTLIGGAAISEPAFEAYGAARVSSYAYLVSLFPDRIASDLGIRLELRERRVAAYAPEGLLVERDAASPRTAASFRALTGSDEDHSE